MNSFHSHINLVPRKIRVRYKKYTISFNINIFTIHFSSKIFCSLPIMPRLPQGSPRSRGQLCLEEDRPIRNVVCRPRADISKYVHILDTVRWIEIAAG